MTGYIEFHDENGTYRITRDVPPGLGEVIENLIIPVLLAAGYSRSVIDGYYQGEAMSKERPVGGEPCPTWMRYIRTLESRVAELESAEPIHRANLLLCQSVGDSLRASVEELEAENKRLVSIIERIGCLALHEAHEPCQICALVDEALSPCNPPTTP